MKRSRLLLLAASVLWMPACSQQGQETTAKPASAPASSVAVAHQEDKEKCTKEPRTDENDKRTRCGGMGTAQPAATHAYRVTLDNGESITSCDITKPFGGKIGHGMVALAFVPRDARGGTVSWHFAGGGGVADTAYDYALNGPDEKMIGTFKAKAAICGKAAGLGVCSAARKQVFSSTWTKIDSCKDAT